MMSKKILGLGAIVVAAILACLLMLRRREPVAAESVAAQAPAPAPAPAEVPVRDEPPQPAPLANVVKPPAMPEASPDASSTAPRAKAAASARAPELTEGQLMAKLRELAASDPALSLKLAKEGNRRFKDSPDAPERASIVVRSLSSMGRHDEARVEALKMEKDYPKSEWTSDVHRHMFINPPNHPTERGHGKTFELE